MLGQAVSINYFLETHLSGPVTCAKKAITKERHSYEELKQLHNNEKNWSTASPYELIQFPKQKQRNGQCTFH